MKLYYDAIKIKKALLLPEGTLEIPENSMTLLRGENGSGKTLLLKNMFLHQKNQDANPFLVDQDNNVFIKRLDVLHNISMCTDEARNREIQQQLEAWGLGYLLTLDHEKLSGGEKRMINVLRGVFSDASLLIFDEPTNDLDFASVEKLIGILQELKETRTLLIVSHDDRLTEKADAVICLRNKQLITEKKTETRSMQTDSETNRQFDLSVLKKVFFYNPVQFLIGLLFVMLLCLQIRSYKAGLDLRDVQTDPDQINLYAPISISLNGEDSLSCCPLSLVSMLNTTNPAKQMKTFSEMDQIIQSRSFDIHALAKLQSTADYTVYPLEFYDPAEKRTVFALDVYLQRFHDTTLDVSVVRTEPYFHQPYQYAYDIQGTYGLEPEKFRQIENELLENENLYPVSAAVRLHSDASAFYHSADCEKLSEANIYACSQEIRQSVAALRELQTILKKSLSLLLGAVVLFAVNYMFNLLYWKNQRNVITAARNYGYQKEAVVQAIIDKTNNRFPLLFLLLAVIGYNIAECAHITFRQSFFVFSLFGVILFSGLYALNNRAAERTVRKLYRWNER